MWWGYSPPLDLQIEINERLNSDQSHERLEILLVGTTDARHITKTLASSYKHPDRAVTYHVIEPTLEQVARSILLISTSLEKTLGLQEATRYYLELLGNTFLRPATAKYLAKHCKHLTDVVTYVTECPWLNLESLKYKDRDHLEAIFKFWGSAVCKGVPIVEYWDRRIRTSLKTRYDYREGVFDWDFHMILKSRDVPYLTIQEYRFWRNNGVAFTWLEGEPARSNPTLLSNIIQHGPGFLHYAYLGDIVNGPYFTWALSDEKSTSKKYRASDMAEQEVMRSIHEVRTKEPLCDMYIAAHRDSSITNGIIVTEMPDANMEQETWQMNDYEFKTQRGDISWVEIPKHKIIFHPMRSLELLKTKPEYMNRFDIIWLAHNTIKELPNIAPLLKKGASMVIELRKYLVELRKEDLQKFDEELRNAAHENGLNEVNAFSSQEHALARFSKL
ncbi:hypothetical protein KM043_007737 [Ampulex compressa]|nr:hypothetical protein KM043_007737 [Ampulex compressa]